MLKLVGYYRKYIHEEEAWQEQQAAAAAAALPPTPGAKPPTSPNPSQQGGRGSNARDEDNALKGHGCCFDQAGFVASHK
jgi:hypothetical protein